MVEYILTIKPSAAKELKVVADAATLDRLIERIKSLATLPRLSGSEKLDGRINLCRIRQGSYRVVSSVNDQSCVVDVVKVSHHSDVYL
ncbi:MAG: type II toxin-antitoxin system RelE family toxin [Cyanobacteriota bacterium]